MIGNAVKAMHIATAQPEGEPKHQAPEGALRKGRRGPGGRRRRPKLLRDCK